jgi:hypothetical protein
LVDVNFKKEEYKIYFLEMVLFLAAVWLDFGSNRYDLILRCLKKLLSTFPHASGSTPLITSV